MDEKNTTETGEFIKKFMEDFSAEFKEFKSLLSSELKEEMENIRTELKADMDTLKADLKKELDISRKETDTDAPKRGPSPFEPPAPSYIPPFVPSVPPIAHPFSDIDEDVHFDLKNNETGEDYDYSDFSRIHVGGSFKAKIVRNDKFSININAKESLFRNIDVSKNGDTLKVNHSKHLGWKSSLSKPEVTITLPALKELRLSGATSTSVSGFSPDEFILHMSGASKLIGDIIAKKVDFDVSGASFLKLTGSAEDAIVKISGANNTQLSDFVINHAAIKISGACNVKTNITGKLDIRLSGASNFRWKGDPVMGDIRISGLAVMLKE